MKKLLIFSLFFISLFPETFCRGCDFCKYITPFFRFFISNKKITLSPVIKKYLVEKIGSDKYAGLSTTVNDFDLSNLSDETVFLDCSIKIAMLSAKELELLLYRFYEKGCCIREKHTLAFLRVVLGHVIKNKQEADSPKFDPRLKFFWQDQQKIKDALKKFK